MKFALNILMALSLSAHAYEVRFVSPVRSDARVLADVLAIHSAPRHWQSIKIDGALQSGQRLKADEITSWLVRQTGETDWHWIGKRETRVVGVRKTSSQSLQKMAKNALRSRLADYDRVELTALSEPQPSSQPLGAFHAEIDLRQPVQSRVCVWLRADGVKRNLWFKVKAYQNVVLTRHVMHRGDVVKATDIIQKSVAINGLSKMPLQQIKTPLRLMHDIPANHWLLPDDVETIPEVSKNDLVDVSLEAKGIHVQFQARAQSDGRIGDVITLLNIHSQQTFKARVIAHQRVEVKA